MNKRTRAIGVMAALAGGFGIGLLAIAAHGASDEMAASQLQTGGLVLTLHALAALISLSRNSIWSALLFVTGGLFFGTAMSLFVFAPGAYIAGLAPIGGISLIVGWLVLAISEMIQK